MDSNWIRHLDNRCPVDPDVIVEIRTEDGETLTGSASMMAWSQDIPADECRIAEYRVVQTEAGALRSLGVGDGLGSGKRYNAGKVPLNYIPASIMADFEVTEARYPQREPLSIRWLDILRLVEGVQMGYAPDRRSSLLEALALINVSSGMWKECAAVFHHVTTRADRPYPAWNWALGMPWSVPLGCMLRHIVFGVLRGEVCDQETGLPHRGHVVCNIVMLLWFLDHYPQGNDLRVPPVSAASPDPADTLAPAPFSGTPIARRRGTNGHASAS